MQRVERKAMRKIFYIHGEMNVLRSGATHETQRVGSDAVGDALMYFVRGGRAVSSKLLMVVCVYSTSGIAQDSI